MWIKYSHDVKEVSIHIRFIMILVRIAYLCKES